MRITSQQSNAFSICISVLAFIFMQTQILQAQSFLTDFGIEVGGGHNQLFWSAPAQYLPPNSSDTRADRTDLSFTPTIRLNYHWDIVQNVSLIPFIGYNQFGGKTKQSNGYQDQFWFDAIESGATSLYSVGNFAFGIGLKANYQMNNPAASRRVSL